MRNYPLNPWLDKWGNWQETYLRELNAKIVALKYYSDFFLTDFVQVSIPLTSIQNGEETVKIISLERLDYHNYMYISEDCYMLTDAEDTLSERFSDGQYYRPVPVGTILISNARPLGSIDSNGVETRYLSFPIKNYVTLNQQYLTWVSNVARGPANPARTNWHNFLLQPAGYASFYVLEPIESGIGFTYYEKGGEEYGTTFNFNFLFNNSRYIILARDLATYASGAFGITIQNQLTNTIQIGCSVDTGTWMPWVSRLNPPMCFHFTGRNHKPNNWEYGEEIIIDHEWGVTVTKVAQQAVLYYNITLKDKTTSYLPKLEVDLI